MQEFFGDKGSKRNSKEQLKFPPNKTYTPASTSKACLSSNANASKQQNKEALGQSEVEDYDESKQEDAENLS